MPCGSGQFVADTVADRKLEIDTEDLAGGVSGSASKGPADD
jgi:hypothetical protein